MFRYGVDLQKGPRETMDDRALAAGHICEDGVSEGCLKESEGLFALCDGMGGYSGGRRASLIALSRIRDRNPVDKASLREALSEANRAITREAMESPEYQDMGCTVTGVLFLKNVDARFIKVLFGIAVILIALEMILRETDLIKLFTKRKTFSERTSNREDLSSKENAIEKTDRKIYRTPAFWIVGLLSGFLCGLYGVGALLGAYLGRVTKDMSSFKGNISLIFLVENTFRIILYGMSGLLNMASIKMALLLVPVAILSLTLGMLAGKKMGDRAVRKTVMILLILSGILLICKNIG